MTKEDLENLAKQPWDKQLQILIDNYSIFIYHWIKVLHIKYNIDDAISVGKITIINDWINNREHFHGHISFHIFKALGNLLACDKTISYKNHANARNYNWEKNTISENSKNLEGELTNVTDLCSYNEWRLPTKEDTMGQLALSIKDKINIDMYKLIDLVYKTKPTDKANVRFYFMSRIRKRSRRIIHRGEKQHKAIRLLISKVFPDYIIPSNNRKMLESIKPKLEKEVIKILNTMGYNIEIKYNRNNTLRPIYKIGYK